MKEFSIWAFNDGTQYEITSISSDSAGEPFTITLDNRKWMRKACQDYKNEQMRERLFALKWGKYRASANKRFTITARLRLVPFNPKVIID